MKCDRDLADEAVRVIFLVSTNFVDISRYMAHLGRDLGRQLDIYHLPAVHERREAEMHDALLIIKLDDRHVLVQVVLDVVAAAGAHRRGSL